jgi:hypothetical protein
MSTNKIGLIIQGTLSGLTNLVVSPNMATLLESSVVKPSLLDERNEIAQFARNTNVFSVENNAQLTIFSIILTDKLDSFKRAGYVAIRLYFPNGVVSQQPVVQILNQLKDKYEEIAKSNTGNFEMYANQFFEIVNAIQTTNGNRVPNLGIQKKACIGFDLTTEDVSQKIQNLSAKSYFSKIYAVPNPFLGNLIQNGYTDISNVHFLKLTINGMFQIVQTVTVNNQSISFDKNNFSLELNVLPSDQILINYKDGRNEQVSPQKGFHNITQKQQPRPQSHPHPKQVGSSNKNNSKNNLLFLGGLVVVLSAILFFFWPEDEITAEQENKSATTQNNDNINANDTTTIQENNDYLINGDTVECVVKNDNHNSFVWKESNKIKFTIYKNKIAIWKPDEKRKDNFNTDKVSSIFKEFKLDSNQIQTKINELINSKKTATPTQNNTVRQTPTPSNTKRQTTPPTTSTNQSTNKPVAKTKKNNSTSTETKSADDL